MKILLFCSVMLLFWDSNAQSFTGGFRIGITGTQVQGDNISGFDKAGISAGFLVGIPLDDYSTLDMELLFVQKGSRRNPTKDDLTKYIMRLNYIEVPFLYRRMLKKSFGFETGLSFGVLIKNTDVEYDIYGLMPSRPPFEKYEVAAHIGFRYVIGESSSVNLRYSHSVLPIRPHPGGVTYYFNRGQYNLALSLTYEYHF
ncbi:MAG: hypothetical protein CVU11_03495 [Bacteroidetes bacterium HGW-Bacteroidetes-6]|jgi:hypothetical protein|nr:MAG: hypothetical protein CVU11_03495 [Bacteroidetes bacterium HGW-Bacteroidetes-6]